MTIEEKKAIGQAIKNYRQKHAYTQQGLANKLGVSLMQVQRWEGAKTLPNGLSMRALIEMKIIPPPRELSGMGQH